MAARLSIPGSCRHNESRRYTYEWITYLHMNEQHCFLSLPVSGCRRDSASLFKYKHRNLFVINNVTHERRETRVIALLTSVR